MTRAWLDELDDGKVSGQQNAHFDRHLEDTSSHMPVVLHTGLLSMSHTL